LTAFARRPTGMQASLNVKIKEDDLAQVYQFDNQLLGLGETVAHAIDNVESSIGTDGLPAAIKNLTTVAQSCVETFNQRSDVLKGIAAA